MKVKVYRLGMNMTGTVWVVKLIDPEVHQHRALGIHVGVYETQTEAVKRGLAALRYASTRVSYTYLTQWSPALSLPPVHRFRAYE